MTKLGVISDVGEHLGGESWSSMKGYTDNVISLATAGPTLGCKPDQAIVAEIEAGQTLVDGNRELIDRFEKKTQAAIAEVWGQGGM